MKSIGKVVSIFEVFQKMVSTEFGAKIQLLCSDNGVSTPPKLFKNAYYQKAWNL